MIVAPSKSLVTFNKVRFVVVFKPNGVVSLLNMKMEVDRVMEAIFFTQFGNSPLSRLCYKRSKVCVPNSEHS